MKDELVATANTLRAANRWISEAKVAESDWLASLGDIGLDYIATGLRLGQLLSEIVTLCVDLARRVSEDDPVYPDSQVIWTSAQAAAESLIQMQRFLAHESQGAVLQADDFPPIDARIREFLHALANKLVGINNFCELLLEEQDQAHPVRPLFEQLLALGNQAARILRERSAFHHRLRALRQQGQQKGTHLHIDHMRLLVRMFLSPEAALAVKTGDLLAKGQALLQELDEPAYSVLREILDRLAHRSPAAG